MKARTSDMAQDWSELTKLTRGAPLTVERVKLGDTGISLEGSFDLPPLARLTMEDQIFVVAFVRSHGSIKEMESLFGISYPTVKNRLAQISSRLDFVEIDPPSSRTDILAELEKGEISVDEALKKLISFQ
jgi:hypothetical protein